MFDRKGQCDSARAPALYRSRLSRLSKYNTFAPGSAPITAVALSTFFPETGSTAKRDASSFTSRSLHIGQQPKYDLPSIGTAICSFAIERSLIMQTFFDST